MALEVTCIGRAAAQRGDAGSQEAEEDDTTYRVREQPVDGAAGQGGENTFTQKNGRAAV